MTTDEMMPGTEDREIVVHRVIDGPRRLVFEAWTRADHLGRWWGPEGFSTTTRAFEFREGGVWEFVMHRPDGVDYSNHVEWRKIVPPERIVYLQGAAAGDRDAFVSTVEFVDLGGRTEITLRTVFNTKAQRDEVVERYGALEGARQTLERLGHYIASTSPSPEGRSTVK